MESARYSRDDLSPSGEDRSARSSSRKFQCGTPQYKFTIGGSRCILALTILSTTSLVHSYVPEKYPIEVYHMLQEKSQYGLGRENRVRGSWGPWSSWSECSRSCGTGVQSQARRCIPRATLRKRSIIGEANATSPKPVCIGTYKRYHICNTQECPEFSGDFRAEQCAKYNGKLYKGENHVWVPFLNAPNPCALNCRAMGQRFYATLQPEVVDGTPCDGPNLRGKSMGLSVDQTEQWLCVAGQCRPVGCDGVVGSGAVRDTCGVCGGQGKGCKLFEGIFMEPILPRGHQPVTTIPKGAMSLNISELRYSSNFLALRSQNGSYLLNGPRSFSPSGSYKTAGTIITYQRGDRNRVECITATGPLNESVRLEIWYHEMNPGIFYRYMLPALEISDDSNAIAPPLYTANDIPQIRSHVLRQSSRNQIPEHRPEANLSRSQVWEVTKKDESKFSTTIMAGDSPNVILPETKLRKRRKKIFFWKIIGLSQCSKSCGGGVQSTLVKCVREDRSKTVPDRRCRNIIRPVTPPPVRCNDRPCPPRWRAEEWSECSVSCGEGVKTRRLECVQDLNSKLTMRVAAGACSQPSDLSTVDVCTVSCVGTPEVGQINGKGRGRWETGPWSPCSSTCGSGTSNRTVICSTPEPCSEALRPAEEKICETPCDLNAHESIWLHSEWSSECSTACDRELETRRVACSDVSELFCDAKKRPMTERRCLRNQTKVCDEAKWFTGPWSPCSVLCGEGLSRREVICIGNSSGESKILFESNCTSSRPPAEQICRMPACPPEWFTSDWNMCSTACDGGTQERIVRCLQEGVESSACEPTAKPSYRRSCNNQPCSNDPPMTYKSPKKVQGINKCVDKYPHCELVVKADLCRIKYYKHSCCGCHI